MPEIKLIAAIDDKNGIAKSKPDTHGIIPWKIPDDHEYFLAKLYHGPVVLGWGTFAANGYKPYGVGTNTVITRSEREAAPGVWIVHDAHEFFERNTDDIWVAGGGQIFKEALPYATHLYLTRVEGDYDCDVFFPEFTEDFKLDSENPEQEENGHKFRYQVWVRK